MVVKISSTKVRRSHLGSSADDLTSSKFDLLEAKFHPIVNVVPSQDESARTPVNPLNPGHKSDMPGRSPSAAPEEETKTTPAMLIAVI
jgi:hypothetical protein